MLSSKTFVSEAANAAQMVTADEGPFSPGQRLGMAKGDLCVFLRMNRIYDWLPDPYDSLEELLRRSKVPPSVAALRQLARNVSRNVCHPVVLHIDFALYLTDLTWP